MVKKFIAFVVSLSMLLCLCSCDKVEVTVKDSKPIVTEAPVENNSMPTEQPQEVSELTETEDTNGEVIVKFVDVGQADGIVLLTPNNKVIVIDAGKSKDASEMIEELKLDGVDKIDFLILTHPHADHIGGAEELIKAYPIDNLIMSSFPATSKLFDSLLNYLMETKDAYNLQQAEVGSVYNIDGVQIEIVAIDTDRDDCNNSSVVCKVSYGDVDFLFTGDAEESTEQVILNSEIDIDSEVLKVGHHGSDTSSSEPFLQAVTPDISVISVGEVNSYGHPSQEVVDRLLQYGEVHRTDLEGTVTVKTDGTNCTVIGE